MTGEASREPGSEPTPDREPGITRRVALGSALGTALALQLSGGLAVASPGREQLRGLITEAGDGLGRGGNPMPPATVAAVAKQIGKGEPVAIVDLAAVDHNCNRLLAWSASNKIAWRPAYKTLRSPELLEYVLAKLDRPRVMIHHLRDLPQALTRVPAGTDFLMGYPPTVGELRHYLRSRPPRNERRHKLRINIDGIKLLRASGRALEAHSAQAADRRRARDLQRRSTRRLRPRRRADRGAEDPAPGAASTAPQRPDLLRRARRRGQRREAAPGRGPVRAEEPHPGPQVGDRSGARLRRHREARRNGPGSSNYTNWAGTTAANEFSAGSAVLFANYLDPYGDTAAGLAKALYMCAPVLRQPKNVFFDNGPFPIPAGTELVFIKSGGWPTGNNPTLSKLVYPAGLLEGPVYGRGSNASGLILARKGLLALGDYVVETPQQVMEGQDYFGGLYAVREGKVRALWPTVSRWDGRREELRS